MAIHDLYLLNFIYLNHFIRGTYGSPNTPPLRGNREPFYKILLGLKALVCTLSFNILRLSSSLLSAILLTSLE